MEEYQVLHQLVVEMVVVEVADIVPEQWEFFQEAAAEAVDTLDIMPSQLIRDMMVVMVLTEK